MAFTREEQEKLIELYDANQTENLLIASSINKFACINLLYLATIDGKYDLVDKLLDLLDNLPDPVKEKDLKDFSYWFTNPKEEESVPDPTEQPLIHKLRAKMRDTMTCDASYLSYVIATGRKDLLIKALSIIDTDQASLSQYVSVDRGMIWALLKAGVYNYRGSRPRKDVEPSPIIECIKKLRPETLRILLVEQGLNANVYGNDEDPEDSSDSEDPDDHVKKDVNRSANAIFLLLTLRIEDAHVIRPELTEEELIAIQKEITLLLMENGLKIFDTDEVTRTEGFLVDSIIRFFEVIPEKVITRKAILERRVEVDSESLLKEDHLVYIHEKIKYGVPSEILERIIVKPKITIPKINEKYVKDLRSNMLSAGGEFQTDLRVVEESLLLTAVEFRKPHLVKSLLKWGDDPTILCKTGSISILREACERASFAYDYYKESQTYLSQDYLDDCLEIVDLIVDSVPNSSMAVKLFEDEYYKEFFRDVLKIDLPDKYKSPYEIISAIGTENPDILRQYGNINYCLATIGQENMAKKLEEIEDRLDQLEIGVDETLSVRHKPTPRTGPGDSAPAPDNPDTSPRATSLSSVKDPPLWLDI